MVYTWEDELKKRSYRRVRVFSYNGAYSVKNLERYQGCDLLILDEAHYIKNPKAKRTQTIFDHYWDEARYKILLSGTPFTRNVIDGYSPFSALMPTEKSFRSFETFADNYSLLRKIKVKKGSYSFFIPQYYGIKNSEKLRDIIRQNFYIRYTKEEVLKDLPELTYQKITLPSKYDVEATEEEKNALRTLKSEVENEGSIPTAAVGSIRRKLGLAKVTPVGDYVEDLLEQEIPVVLFAHHRDVIAEFETRFKKYVPAVITGATDNEKRFNEVKRFQDGNTLLFIGNLAAAGVGITLTRGSNCVLAELDYSPSVLVQAVSRLHRMTQKNPVNVYYFVVDGSLEESIIESVVRKSKEFSSVVDN